MYCQLTNDSAISLCWHVILSVHTVENWSQLIKLFDRLCYGMLQALTGEGERQVVELLDLYDGQSEMVDLESLVAKLMQSENASNWDLPKR